MSPALHTEEIAARWLLRREESDWSSEDQEQLDVWLGASPENKVTFWRLEHGWQKVDRLAALRSPPAPRRQKQPLLRLWRPAAAAASIAACLAVGALVLPGTGIFSHRSYTTEVGGRATVPLPDGTKVELNTAIADTQHGATPPPPVLTRGDMVIVQGPSMLVPPKSVEKVAGQLSWRQGLLTFDQSTLQNAASEFNRYNRKKLVIGDPQAAAMRIGGSFEAENVDAFARLLQQAYGLKIEDDGDTLKISS